MSNKAGIHLSQEEQVFAEVDREIERTNRKIKRALQYAGEAGVNVARDPNHSNTFTDRTGNLRSSIGSVVVEGNNTSYSGFGSFGSEGNSGSEGRRYAKEVATEFQAPYRLTLAVVAGKEYASYVAANGYDVLDAAEITSKNTFEQLMK